MTIKEAAHTLYVRLNGNATSHRNFVAIVGVGTDTIHLSFYRKADYRQFTLTEWEGYPIKAVYGGVPRLN
jgi:hypothetical protein